jgi:hypothetical protein
MARSLTIFGVVLSTLLASAVNASGAAQCSKVSYKAGRAQLSQYLSGQGYSSGQVRFLLRNADQQTGRLRVADLNAGSKACGIDSARAHVLGCTRSMMPGLLRDSKDLDAKKSYRHWGRSHHTVRELMFIGGFYACLGSAKDAMFR